MSSSRLSPAEAMKRSIDALGEAWASQRASELRGEGRIVAGGWPGTLTEARHRVTACAIERFGSKARFTPEQLDVLARRAYDMARTAWLARTESSGED